MILSFIGESVIYIRNSQVDDNIVVKATRSRVCEDMREDTRVHVKLSFYGYVILENGFCIGTNSKSYAAAWCRLGTAGAFLIRSIRNDKGDFSRRRDDGVSHGS